MTQLILDIDGVAIALPESVKGGYIAYEEDMSVQIPMIAGNMVTELGGKVWKLSYQYGFFNEADKNRVISACRKGRRTPIICSFIPPESEDAIVTNFFVTSFKEPKFMWSTTLQGDGAVPKPMWADFSVELREVRPHA